MANISVLTSDLLVVVFCRLEVECLLSCTSVCKTWYHIIKSPSCAKSHLTYRKTSSNAKKYILHQDSKSCTLLSDIEPLIDGTQRSRLYHSPGLFDESKLRIHGFCDGLLCISNDGVSDRGYCVGDNIYLWNPICRKAKKLPELKITDEFDGVVGKGGLSFGFYDNDYKVIVISCVDRKFIVSVYSLSSNCWNVVHTNSYYENKIEDQFDDFCVKQPTKFVDGVAYMITDIFGSKRLSYETPNAILPVIVCFDLRDQQTIRQFKCPDEFLGYKPEYTMEVYGQTIAVLECDMHPGFLTMWVLLRDKFSSESPWERKLIIKLTDPCDYPIPVGFLCDGKYMVMKLFAYENGMQTTFYLCDLESKKVTECSSRVENPDFYYRINSNCVESLLLLNEDSVDPFVHSEMESSCSSMLFTLRGYIDENGRKRKR